MAFETTTEQARSESPPRGEPVFLELDEAVETVIVRAEDSAIDADEAAAPPPGWFGRKRAKSAAEATKPKPRRRRKRSAIPAIAARPEDRLLTAWQEPTLLEKLTYLFRSRAVAGEGDAVENPRYERFKRLLAFAATGYGFSLILHTLITLVLAVIGVHAAQSSDNLLFFSDSVTESVEIEEIDTTLDLAGGAEEQLEPPQIQVVDVLKAEPITPSFPDELRPKAAAVGTGEGDKKGDGDGLGFAMPESGKVVTKGSFSVWTVPEDPAPGQNYLIIIQVKLPDDVKRYRRSDLSGMVVGTDGYRQRLPGSRRGWLPVKDNKAQLAVFVPAAERLVRDTINVRSKRLKEKQELEIVF